MINLNMVHWRQQLISNEKRYALPVMTHPGIEQTGHRIIDAVTNGRVHFEAIQYVATHFQTAAATMIMDLTVEAEAFGSPVKFNDYEIPTVTGRIVHDSDSIFNLRIPMLTDGRLPEFIEAARLAAEKITDKPVFGGCIGPFSLAGRLFDMSEIMTAAFLEPAVVKALLEKCSAFLKKYIEALKKTGVNGIIMAEPAAGLLNEELCEMFSSSYIKEMVHLFQDEHFMFILHNCGNTGHLTHSMAGTGAHALHFGNSIALENVFSEVHDDMLVIGNIDPVGIIKLGTPEKIKETVGKLLHNTSRFRNFILSSGCDIPPGVPYENINAFFEALDDFNNPVKP